MSELIPYNDVRDMALAIFNSGFTGCKKPEEVLALMMLAQAEGKHPAIIQRDYHMVSGKPTLKADTILARFQEAGGTLEYLSYTDEECRIVFTHPRGGSLEVSWDIARANRAGVTGNPTWKKYPRAMLRSRCISEGVRSVYPVIMCGMYTPEEQESFSTKEPKSVPVEVIEHKKPTLEAGPNLNNAIEKLLNGSKTMEDLTSYYDVPADIMKIIVDTVAINNTIPCEVV